MKLDTASSKRSIYNVLRSPSGVLIHGPSCPRGILTASHWLSDFKCACVALVSASEVNAKHPARSAVPTPSGAETRTPRPNSGFAAGTDAGSCSQMTMEVG